MGYISYPRSAGVRLDPQRVHAVIRLIEGIADIVMPSTLDGILTLVNQIGWHNLPPGIKAKLLALMRNQLYPKLEPQITATPQEQQSYRSNIQALNSKMVDIGLSLNHDTLRPIHERLNETGAFDFRVAQPIESKVVTAPLLIDSNGMILRLVAEPQEVNENQGQAIIHAIHTYPNDADVLLQSYLSGKYSALECIHADYRFETSNADGSKNTTLTGDASDAAKILDGKVDDAVESVVKSFVPNEAQDDIIELSPGSKGSWTKALNGKLEPNHKYKVGDHLYETDELGRVNRVSGKLDLTTRDRNTYQQGKSAKENGIKDGLIDDDGGHLVASIFDGAGEQINYAPMNSNLNRSAWKRMENTWGKALKIPPPKEVKIDIKPIYEGASKRPEAFKVRYWINGKKKTKFFKNEPGG